jgi:protein-disulfide isomerase
VDITSDFEVASKYGVQATPTIVVLDKDGDVEGFFVGVPDKAELKDALDKATD